MLYLADSSKGNTGLGYEAIKALAARGPAHIYMASRTESKATKAIADIQKSHSSAKISYLPLDLTSFASIRAAADTFQSESKRLDILMLNAGIMAVPLSHTKEGFEIQLGTNHLGHFLLTKLLLPTLQASTKLTNADVRVVCLTSEAHNFARSRFPLFSQSELEKCSAWGRYGYSKLANILFVKELARRHPEILSLSVHPGLVSTDLYQTTQQSNMFMKVGLMVGGWLRVTAEQGALGQLWASVASRGRNMNGAYYKPIGVKSSGNWLAADAKLAEEFWEWTENEVLSKGY